MKPYEYATMYGVEENYWWYRGLRGLVARLAAERLPARPRLLDAGCGTGGQLAALRPHLPGLQAHGLDISPAALDFTRRRGFERLARGSAGRLPFAAASFDAALSLDVLYRADLTLPDGLAEISRILRPGGWLFLNLPAFAALSGEHDQATHIDHRYTAAEVRAALQAAGLQVRELFYWNVLFFAPAWLVRRLRRPADAAAPRSDLTPLPGPVNVLLTAWLALEIRLARRLPLPFGTSVFALARKPEA